MVRKAKQLGHVAFVSSDHDYCMTPEKYEQQLLESNILSEFYQMPVVCGLEISLGNEEAVLIGTDACRAWLRMNALSMGHREIGNMLKSSAGAFNHGLCLVHPACYCVDATIYPQMHCFEIMNSGCPWSEPEVQSLQKLMPTAKQVRGCDAHGTMSLECPCNEVSEGAWNEEAIIQWMRS
jgi:hypothetical protein